MLLTGFVSVVENAATESTVLGLSVLDGSSQFLQPEKQFLNQLVTKNQTEKQQKIKNRNGKKNNCMGILSDKLIRLHTEWSGHGKERETLTEKLGP